MKENEEKVLQEVLHEVKLASTNINKSTQMVETVKTVPDHTDTELQIYQEKAPKEVLKEYQQFYNMNQDFVGWLTLDGADIDYPVLQNRENPDFYLSHNFLKEEQRSGSIFLDGVARTYPKDANVVIYGHNMHNGSMFGNLKKYKDEAFYQEYTEFEFDTCYERGKYKIVSVVVTDILEENDFYYYLFRNYNEKEFEMFQTFIRENQLYETGDTLEYGDETVILSTCEGSTKTSRLIVIGVAPLSA